MESEGLDSCSSLLAGSDPHLHLQSHFSGNSHSHDAKYPALYSLNTCPLIRPNLSWWRSPELVSLWPHRQMSREIRRKDSPRKEGARELTRRHRLPATALCLPLLCLIPLLQSPGNQGKERANKKGPGTKRPGSEPPGTWLQRNPLLPISSSLFLNRGDGSILNLPWYIHFQSQKLCLSNQNPELTI